jgi:hypothetical protein
MRWDHGGREEWERARDTLRAMARREVAGRPDPKGALYSAAEERARAARPDLAELVDSMGLAHTGHRGGHQQPTAGQHKPSAVVISATGTERPTTEENNAMKDQRPSPRPPLRRARLDQHGNAITWTETGVIINDLEIIHEPTRDEASREIGARQRKYMLAGVEAHAALAQALEEVHPVYRNAYTR